MLALYGSGRQADALERYAAGRRAMVDELGIEPGGALGSWSGASSARTRRSRRPRGGVAGRPAAAASRARRRPIASRRPRALIALGAAVSSSAPSSVSGSGRGGDEAGPAIPGDSVVLIDPGSGRAETPVALGGSPSGVALTDGAVWVGDVSRGALRRVDPEAGAVVETIPLGGGPDGIAAGGDAVWATNGLAGTLLRVSPETNGRPDRRRADRPAGGRLRGRRRVGGEPLRPRRDARRRRHRPRGVDGPGRRVADRHRRRRRRGLDDQRDRCQRLAHRPGGPAASSSASASATGPARSTSAPGRCGSANTLDGTVSRIDPATNAVSPRCRWATAPRASRSARTGSGWRTSSAARWRGSTRAPTRSPRRSRRASARRAGARRRPPLGRGARRLGGAPGGTLRVAVEDLGPTIDQVDYSLLWNLNLTGDGLTAYRRVAGTDGAELVPDLAVSIPTPADDGRTYTFQLRRGVRYSTGEPVRPGDVRRAVERYYRLGPASSPLLRRHRRGGGLPQAAGRVRPLTGDRRGRRGEHRDDPPGAAGPQPGPQSRAPVRPRRCAVRPADGGDPPRPAGDRPYMVAGYRPGRELRLVRNPRFRSGRAPPGRTAIPTRSS